ncbi:hypothetical protein [Arthrobacter sp. S39]|uniref:hypothetical protein n=1 Tax=Arthrobacter sp. S39 TaxID=2509720 RepID=UPI0010379936|nr:hypothetical protein [Arthrobacter sp. S39]TAP43575.1 hypothetical protein EYS21_12100 [Arthrobacter sp. S39]
MDRKLHALATRDVLTDTVRIDIRGSLTGETRPALVNLVRRVRALGIPSHIHVDLSRAAYVESAALAGLRNDLNAIDGATLPGMAGSGVSLVLTPRSDAAPPEAGVNGLSLAITDELADTFADGAEGDAHAPLDPMFGRPLAEYSDDELLTASDSIFALLDEPEAFAGSDLLARYNEIGQELARRNPMGGLYDPAREGLAAS